MVKKLELVYIDAGNLKVLEGNPRQLRDSEGVKKLKTLIEEHGFQNPLQVWKGGDDKGYTILCGNHRYIAGSELNITSFPCIVYDGTKEKALARALSDNKSSEWTEWLHPALSDVIVKIDVGDFSVPDLTGFSPIELENLSSWESDIDEVNKTNETSEGLKGVIKITCERGDAQELKEYIQGKLEETSFEGVLVV